MIDILTTQACQVLEPIDLNGGAATAFYFDTNNGGLGTDWVRFIFSFGNIAANVTTAPVVTECETSGGSYTSITGSGATVASTDDGKIIVTDIDYRSKGTHKRFLSLSITGGAGACLLSVVAIVAPKVTPTSSSNVGNGCSAGATKGVLAWNQV